MISRTNYQTQPSQPVRFYKLVALSFLLLTLFLLGVIIFMSSKRATITITSKEDLINIEENVVIGDKSQVNSIDGMVTSTLITLKKKFQPTGNKEVVVKSEGMVTLHNETNAPQPLVATTRLLTPNNILFRIKKSIVVPANGTIKAEVAADKEGGADKIEPTKFTIPGLSEAKQKVIYATNEEPILPGVRKVGVLSNDDIENAKKIILAEAENQGKATLTSNKENNDFLSIFSVIQSTAETKAEIGKEIAEFEIEARATVLGVFYKEENITKILDKEFSKKIIVDSETVQKGDNKPSVKLNKYDLEKRTAELTVYQTGSATLNAESRELQKNMFFGKNQEEVRRYLMSLDHVYSVDVEFKPLWINTVPFVPDHVKVIVKKVQ